MNTIRKHLNTIAVSHKYIKKSGDVMAQKRGEVSSTFKCDSCGGGVVEIEEPVYKGSKVFMLKAWKCKKCGEHFTDLYEYEKVRKEMHPSILKKIKHLLSFEFLKDIDVSRRKVL